MCKNKNIDIKIFGRSGIEDSAVEQLEKCSTFGNCVGAALMADAHLGYSIPIGGVIAYKDMISPSAVGFDISCGNKAVRLDIKIDKIRNNLPYILDTIFSKINFGVGGENYEKVDDEVFYNDSWELEPAKKLKDLAKKQFGTIGSGNHFIDIFKDDEENVWVGIHCGSRGFGNKLAQYFIKAAGGKDGIDVEPTLLHTDSDLGKEYIECMNLAGDYSYAARNWICKKVSEIIGGNIAEEVHNNHNFAWKEKHNYMYAGESFYGDIWVMRKGSTPAFPGQKGFIGGSMGDISVIVEGIDTEESKQSFYSTVHGAGRVLGRMEAKGKRKICKDKNSPDYGKERVIREPKITPEMMNKWIKEKGIELRGAGVDESPHCYKRLPEVLESHKGSIKILKTLTPVGVVMA